MEEKLQEDWLDARLRDEAPYIDDAGFTSRVVQKMPARHVRRSYRAFILIGITVAACLAAFWLAGGISFAIDAYASFVMMPLRTIWAGLIIATAVVMSGGLALALTRSRGRSR
ncbi:MAG TPA: DUF5056 domain-containing protein [Chthoniobacterales bacterium]